MSRSVTGKKRCTVCGTLKPFTDFNCRYDKNRFKSYYVNPCKKCHNKRSAARTKEFRATPEGAAKHREYKKQWRQRNPDKKKREDRAQLLRKNYNMTIADYEAMLSLQGGVCAICKQSPGTRRLHVDHDHKTGVVRALLCHGCNLCLGAVDDDISKLQAAIAYLRKYEV